MILRSKCAEKRVHSITRQNGPGKVCQQNKAARLARDVEPRYEIQHTVQERELTPRVEVRKKSEGSTILHPRVPPSTPHAHDGKQERQNAEIIRGKLVPGIHS